MFLWYQIRAIGRIYKEQGTSMKPSPYILLAACLAIAAALPVAAATTEPAALSQDLVNVRASDKIRDARWMRQADSYTLQILRVGFIGETIASLRGLDPTFSPRNPTPPVDQSPATAKIAAKIPKIQVWVLRADGTEIIPVRRSGPSFVDTCPDRKPGQIDAASAHAGVLDRSCLAMQLLYGFPAAEGAQAVAVAISVDDDYYIEKLRALEPDPAAK